MCCVCRWVGFWRQQRAQRSERAQPADAAVAGGAGRASDAGDAGAATARLAPAGPAPRAPGHAARTVALTVMVYCVPGRVRYIVYSECAVVMTSAPFCTARTINNLMRSQSFYT